VNSRVSPSLVSNLSLAAGLEQVKHPIGVFDSGVGGLSVLKALRAELPHEDFVYVADSGFAPYGERDALFVIERSRRIARHLIEKSHPPIKALVVACNTATASAIAMMRQDYPDLPIVGVEPALKPAIAASRTHRIGVMATRGTLESDKFKALKQSLSEQATFICQPCDGLADAIERDDASQIVALCEEYTRAIGQFGIKDGEVDTLVLGCTHYPFVRQHLQHLLGSQIGLIDNGEPVARQTRRVLTALASPDETGHLQLFTTAAPQNLTDAAQRWLGVTEFAQALALTDTFG
jgi:glutamate racemase